MREACVWYGGGCGRGGWGDFWLVVALLFILGFLSFFCKVFLVFLVFCSPIIYFVSALCFPLPSPPC